MQTKTILPLQQAMARAGIKGEALILETELEQKDGRYVYEVEILGTDGEVYKWHIDAATGRLIRKQMEH